MPGAVPSDASKGEPLSSKKAGKIGDIISIYFAAANDSGKQIKRRTG